MRMLTIDRPPAQSRTWMLLILVTGVGLLAGCSTERDLTITSVAHNQTYRPGLTHAYANRNQNGDLDVVLIDDATEQALTGAPSAPVEQIMHIRVVWSPSSDAKAVTSNAAVNWYVIGRARPQDLLIYSGIAFVKVAEGDGATRLSVRNALLTASANHGRLNDPLGSAQLDGSITARQDSDKVAHVLAKLNASVAAASAQPPVAETEIAK